MTLTENLVAEAITEKIKELMIEDLSKSDIRELITSAHPNFPNEAFSECYSKAFTTMVG